MVMESLSLDEYKTAKILFNKFGSAVSYFDFCNNNYEIVVSGENYNNLLTSESRWGILRRLNNNKFCTGRLIFFVLVMFFLI